MSSKKKTRQENERTAAIRPQCQEGSKQRYRTFPEQKTTSESGRPLLKKTQTAPGGNLEDRSWPHTR